MQRELNVLALMKGEERFVFIYEDDSVEQLIEKLRAWAADPELNFSWFDAAVMTERARQQAAASASPEEPENFQRTTRIVES